MDNLNYFSLASLLKSLSRESPDLVSAISPALPVKGKYLYGFAYCRQALKALVSKKSWKRVGLPGFTCPVLNKAIEEAGAKPISLDVDPKTLNLSTKTPLPKEMDALVVVHTFGTPADIPTIRQKLGNKVPIIEDCAQALGGSFKDKPLGSFGDYVLVSLYKQIANLGGSILLSFEPLDFSPLKYLNPLPITAPLYFSETNWLTFFLRKYLPLPNPNNSVGEICSLPDLWLKLAARQLSRFPSQVRAKREMAAKYQAKLNKDLFEFQNIEAGSACFSFSVLIKFGGAKARDHFLERLHQKGIFADRQWFNAITAGLPVAADLADRILNFPFDLSISTDKLEKQLRIVNSLGLEIAHV